MSTSVSVIFAVSNKGIFAKIETIEIGNNSLIPKTAIIIPQVKNLCCQTFVIFSSLVALITALSNDKLISKILNTNTTNIEKYVQFFRDFRENSEITDFSHLTQIEEIENLDRETQIFEFLMMGFRLLDGPNAEDFFSRFGENIENYVKEPLSRWQKKNLAVCTENKYALNQQGLLLLNSFMQELF